MKIALLEYFTFNDFLRRDNDADTPGQAHIVCVWCSNKYDMVEGEQAPPPMPKECEYWYVWLLDHSVASLLTWCQQHVARWHPEKLPPKPAQPSGPPVHPPKVLPARVVTSGK